MSNQQGVHGGKDGPKYIYGKLNLDYVSSQSPASYHEDLSVNPLGDFHASHQEQLDADTVRDYLDDIYNTSQEEYSSPEYDDARNLLYKLSKQEDDQSDMESIVGSLHEPDSGATVDVIGKKFIRSGFAYSPYPERSKKIDNYADLRPSNLTSFLEENKDILSEEGNYLGLWHDPDTGAVYIDISVVNDDAKKARRECWEKDQLAFFDLQHLNSVTVNPHAKSGQE